MIFITAQGYGSTSEETILDILDILDFDDIRKVKIKNKQGDFQLMVTKLNKVICFINFISGQGRSKFLKESQALRLWRGAV